MLLGVGFMVVALRAHPGARTEGPDPIVGSVAAGPTLTASPPSWWMLAGSTVVFAAAWVDLPPGCTLDPAWFLWGIGPAGAVGSLASTEGPVVNFTALAIASGTSELLVRASATLVCGNASTGIFGLATANVSVEAPLELQDLLATPNPVVAGGLVSLTGSIAGGAPPFRLEVTWGSGLTAELNVSSAGPFSVASPLPAGIYRPSIVAYDAVGDFATATTEETVNASTTFAAAILPSTPAAEVGIPVEFSIATVDAPTSGYSSVLACENASGAPAATGPACTFDTPGIASVLFEGVGAGFPFPEASAVLNEPVAPPVSLGFLAGGPPAEVGVTAYVPVNVSGGVPPFDLSWRLVGDPVAGSIEATGDGTVFVAIQPAQAGADLLTVSAVDGLGARATPVEEVLDVDPSLAGVVSGAAVPRAGGIDVNLSFSALTGTAPFLWSIALSSPAWNATPVGGELPGPGSATFEGISEAEGGLAATVRLVDAAGAAWGATMELPTVPPLTANASFRTDARGGFSGVFTITGGAPPFLLRVNGTGGGSWNASFPADGEFAWSPSGGPSGPITIQWSLTDRFGETALGTADLADPGAQVVDAVPALAVAAGILAAIGVGVGLVAWWTRRPRVPPEPPPDPVEVLRAIVEPADGADRALVELEAEEAGVPFSVVRSTLDRLIAAGTIRAERGLDGEEVLAWERRPG